MIAAPKTVVKLDGVVLDGKLCTITPGDGLDPASRKAADPPYIVYTCQLSFATIDPTRESPDNVLVGMQNDGVHRVLADAAVGLIVSGFDAFVSYGYAGGTELREINTQ